MTNNWEVLGEVPQSLQRTTAKSQRGPSSRQMRSQAALEWSVVAELVLVNEVAAVESDCATKLSLYKRWKIITENCAAQDVPGTSASARGSGTRCSRTTARSTNSSPFAPWKRRRIGRYKARGGLHRSFIRELFATIGIFRGCKNQPEPEQEMSNWIVT